MDIHFGSSSYLSKCIRKNKKTFLFSSKKKADIYEKFNFNHIGRQKFEYIFIFLGKNFKNKNKNKSYLINYKLPLMLLKKLQRSKQKIKIIFFGSFSEYDKLLDQNRDYINHKIALRKKIIELHNKNESFEFVWLYLPNIYGKNQSKNFLIPNLINDVKKNKTININNGYKKIYLLNIEDFKIMIDHIKTNWTRIKNRSIYSIFEGPFFLNDIILKFKKIFRYKKEIKIKFKSINEKNFKSSFKLKVNKSFYYFIKNVK